ncbi:MAG TPA: FAD/NAD(P)-binding oxidoreductase [Candidatus Polarisedimenticolia bacterium]|jgi:NADPH-dependent 2,4-dienoyl-CoA reductase/sulfur reductase-like enzyme|nr:FAD/NAD(P)-binding oxidoreductase [Candidatus Polarisedimenticolia bacterium]
MTTTKYLIIGGGMAGDAAVHGIREVDPDGSITVIGAEAHPAYDRPPLSKALWKGKPLEKIWRDQEDKGVTYHRGRRAMAIDARNKRVTDDEGKVHGFERLLIAMGATPRRLAFGGDPVIHYRTLDDYRRLRALTESSRRFAVIGGGFIGSEIAAALAMNGREVVLVFPDDGLSARVFPADLSRAMREFYREKGIDVRSGTSVVGLEAAGITSVLTLHDARAGQEKTIEVDGVVAGIGVRPNVELAQAAGLQTENGIRVDASLRTTHPDIFAAGDVASFHNPALDTWMRVEHEDNANTMGRLAGRSMAGEAVSYDHLPSFYSDLFDRGYEAVGDLDPRLETVADWKDPFREGVVYYLRGGRVRGVLLWNVWEQVDNARRLIGQPGPFDAKTLKGRLPA